MPVINRTAFKDCDIRGKYPEEVNEAIFRHVGFAFGHQVLTKKVAHLRANSVVVAGDHRRSTAALKKNFLSGLAAHDLEIIDLGVVPTTIAYWAKAAKMAQACAVVTASHNPPQFNGLKIMNGESPPTPQEIQNLAEAYEDEPQFSPGPLEKIKDWPEAALAYQAQLISTFSAQGIEAVSIVIDPGNGCQAGIASHVFEQLGARVTAIHDQRDGLFRERHPDCAIAEHLTRLIARVKNSRAHLGIAFDGDGDRLAVVDDKGRVLGAERLGMILLQGPLRPQPEDPVILDIKCSMQIERVAEALQGRPLRCKSGHAYMKAMVLNRQAILGLELSGHVFLRQIGGRDDPLYTALLLCAYLVEQDKSLSAFVDELPTIYMTPDVRIPMSAAQINRIIERCRNGLDDAMVQTVDGVRLVWREGWLLVRRSITESKITLRIEGERLEDLRRIARRFMNTFPELASHVQDAVDRVTR